MLLLDLLMGSSKSAVHVVQWWWRSESLAVSVLHLQSIRVPVVTSSLRFGQCVFGLLCQSDLWEQIEQCTPRRTSVWTSVPVIP